MPYDPTPNRVNAGLKLAFQKHGDELVQALLALTKSDDERVRLGAIQAALDRGWGKPTQAVDLAGAVYLSRDAWQRVDGRCRGQPLGPVLLKGKGEIEVYRCDGINA